MAIPNSLTPKQRRFAEEYLVDLCATQAAIRAGYSAKTAPEQGARLLINVKVAAAIAAAQSERSKRTEITADRVLQELARIGFSDMRRFATWGPEGVCLVSSAALDEDAARCVVEVSESTGRERSLKFKLHDKVAALTLLGKHLGMYTDKVEHSGEIRNAGVLAVPVPLDDVQWGALATAQQATLVQRPALAQAPSEL